MRLISSLNQGWNTNINESTDMHTEVRDLNYLSVQAHLVVFGVIGAVVYIIFLLKTKCLVLPYASAFMLCVCVHVS